MAKENNKNKNKKNNNIKKTEQKEKEVKKVDIKEEKEIKKDVKKVEVKEKRNTKKTVLTIIAIIVGIVVLFFLSEAAGDRSNDKTLKPSTSDLHNHTEENANPLISSEEEWDESEEAELPQIDYEEFRDAVKAKDVTVVMLGHDGCIWCNYQKPVLKHVLYQHSDINIVYLDISELDSDGRNYLVSLDSELADFGTPAFVAVKGGKAVKVDTNGAKGVQDIEKMLKDMGAM